MRMSLRITIAAVCISGALAARVEAQPAPRPADVFETRSQLGASVNNAGLQQSFDWMWRRSLSASSNPLVSEAHLSAGGTAAVTPASLRGGVWVEIAPASFFVVRAGVDPSQYFGAFDSLTSFDSRQDAFDSDARRARHAGRAGRTTRLYVTPTVRLRAGHFAGQSSLDLERWSSSAAGPFFYEPTRDVLLAAGGDRVANLNTAVVYEHQQRGGGTLSFGPIHSLTRVHARSFNQIQRLGAVLTEQTTGRHFGLLQPRATVIVARYLDDASKRGEWSAALAIGFTLKRR